MVYLSHKYLDLQTLGMANKKNNKKKTNGRDLDRI